jgi:glycerol-3-phosphate O-acyltransferase/dihydroxyacetone phosphate acyltransferase
MICFDGVRVLGKDGTKFTQLQKGDRIRPGKSAESYRIKEVVSDTEGIIAVEYGEATPLHERYGQGNGNWCNYDILGYVDQAKMFDAVQAALAQGHCLGIFPEGGSHDNTDLLPLKAGVAAIALGVLDKYGISVPIVPVGLNYFRGYRFRGRVVVEFGQPITITKDLFRLYREGGGSKRTAYQELLSQIEYGMRSVIVTAPDYSELKMIHTVRRLYQRSTSTPTIWKQDIARRFSVAYKLVKDKYGDLPDDLKELQKKIENYQDILERWGLRDYQVSGGNLEVPYTKMLYIFLHGAVIMALASIPSLILNAPVGFAADYWSKKEAAKDLKNSRVKVAARDVLLSKKIVFSIVAIPCLWVFYAMLLMLFSPLEWKAIAVLFLCCPLFSYLGVMAVQAGMVDWKDLRPAFLRLLPSFREETQRLPALRHSLQKDVRAMVKKYGPELGPLYFEKSSTWEKAVQARKKIGQEIGLRVSDSKLDFVEDTAALSGEEDMEQPGSDGSISPVVHKKAV